MTARPQPAPLRAGAAQVEITPPMGTQISGDIAIVGLPGEPFVEGQLRVKVESPAYPTYVAHNCNDLLGYVPTPRAFQGGGYETRTSNWSCLAPEALDMMSDRAMSIIPPSQGVYDHSK